MHVHDEASFLEFVRQLAKERSLAVPLEKAAGMGTGAPLGWENSSIESFLEAACAWADDTQFGRTQGLGAGESPWRRFAVFLHCGKIYE